jgi:hypothetical protein
MGDILGEAILPAFVSIASPLIGDELISLTMTTNNLLTNALSNRMTNVKGCLADPFVQAIYGDTRREHVISECGYKNNMYGFVLGIDDVWTFANEKYFRLGADLGYVHGKTIPFGAFSRTGKAANTTFNLDAKQLTTGCDRDVYTVGLFGAYESFDDKCLKTNIGVILEYSHSRDRLYDVNLNILNILNAFNMDEQILNVKFVSHNIFLGAEFIKNLCAYGGFQFGLWLQANYSHISQHSNEILGGYRAKLDHDFLATVVGLNVEKEAFKHTNKKLALSLKAGWEFRVVQSFDFVRTFATFVTAAAFNDVNRLSRYPVRNAAVISFRASQKLNDHWSIVGSYTGRFSKNFLAHNLSAGIEYSF